MCAGSPSRSFCIMKIMRFRTLFAKFKKKGLLSILNIGFLICGIGFALTTFYIVAHGQVVSSRLSSSMKQASQSQNLLQKITLSFEDTKAELTRLKNEDQYQINQKLGLEIKNIQKSYSHTVKTYEALLDLQDLTKKTDALEKQFASALTLLSNRDYAKADTLLLELDKKISDERAKIASAFTIPENVSSNNAPPGSGYRRQKVDTPVGSYLVDIIAADLNSARVIVDTASDGTCGNDCPVMSLGSYASRSGAFAGINGPYFCPAAYPSCAGKANSFETLLMNKNKVYFNSENNVYSSVPAVIFSGNSARFVGASSGWGRDTGVDSVIASQPLLMSNGQRVYGGDGEPKRSGKGSRSFIGSTGSTVYIGVVHNASVAEVAYVLETLSVSSALNLDSGGSTALWNGGRYLIGPGRDTPFGILLVGN